jgi:hypothetical protein
MLAAEHYPYYDGAVPNRELFEIHNSKISLHRAKTDYSYPTIRLPHTLSKLAGFQTRFYQNSSRRSARVSCGRFINVKKRYLLSLKMERQRFCSNSFSGNGLPCPG